MNKPAPRWLPVLAVVAVAAGATGCSSSHHSAGPTPSGARPTATAVASASIPGPTPATAIICADEAKFEISSVIGATPTAPLKPTWTNDLYTCVYHYGPTAAMTLSVKQLPDQAGEAAYYESLRHAAGSGAKAVQGLGDQAFSVPDGSVYVRKDLNVLRVDVHALPARFGNPVRTHRQVGLVVATTIMSCWKEL
ncbi:hypothetical protein [Streptomyces sp. CA-111067]|uniref:hypothetical protein n=1 Tax=Streptomyces sp. CA-111067 TaxID=3240046 RepID=UPI003D9900DA